MSSVVRLNVPPFESAAPTSLAALHRSLVPAESTQCDAHCNPCPKCLAAQEQAMAEAGRLARDLGLRLSQLVEDALAQHVAKMEADQSRLIGAILSAILPDMADASLRSSLAKEITEATDSNPRAKLVIAKNPALKLGDLPDDSRLSFQDDDSLPLHQLQLSQDSGKTLIDPDSIIEACVARLNAILNVTAVKPETE